MKKLFVLAAALGATACTPVTPLPDVRGSMVRPLNPTKWNYQEAVLQKQKEIGLANPADQDSRGS